MTPGTPLVVAAAQGTQGSAVPVWFMRQAGRSLPEYRAIRERHGMLESCFDAELLTEITLQPVRRHGVDAAILFSDIVVPLKAIGIDLDIVEGTGPVIAQPVRTRDDLKRLRDLDEADVAPILEGIRGLRAALGDTALIGFAGAPFTLAAYLVEGGPSRTFPHTRAMMEGDPELWSALLSRLAAIAGAFLRMQIEAGAQVVQLFDSWVGSLSPETYRSLVLPHSRAALASATGVPRIHFGVGTGAFLRDMGEAGAEVVGVDSATSLEDAIAVLGDRFAVQGNLDPAMLTAPWPELEGRVLEILREGRAARGHIFNLGHGVPKGADPDVLTRIVDLVHAFER